MLDAPMPGKECDGKACDVRRRGCASVADLMVGTAAGHGAGGDLGRARQLREGVYDTGSSHDLAGLQSEAEGAAGTTEDGGDEVPVVGNRRSVGGLCSGSD